MRQGIIPSGQPTQLVGLPPLSEETYHRLGRAMRELYEQYRSIAERQRHSIAAEALSGPQDDPDPADG